MHTLKSINESLFSSIRHDWNTPETVLKHVREFRDIGLDPCSNATSIVGAVTEWTEGGLDHAWGGHGLVFVNPPYGREVSKWADKVTDEALKGVEIIALVPARTDARWFQSLAEVSDGMCFWSGRVKFLGAAASAPFPSALFYFGESVARFLSIFGCVGFTIS